VTARTVGAFEAKTHFSALLEAAERGETIVVTKKGRPVAQLGPITENRPSLAPERAMKQLLSMNVRLGQTTIRDLLEEGRRH